MPELPEVEEVRRSLEPHILGRAVSAVDLRRRDFLSPLRAPIARLISHRFTETSRHGKRLFCRLDDDQTLVFHLGMSGRIDAVPSAAPLESHTHLILRLDSATDIRVRDPRRFGGVWYYRTFQAAWAGHVAGHLGPDALTLTAEHLAHWRHTRGTLKARLLAQRDVAGLGNIYVDEALWLSRLHPLQRVARLKPQQLADLVAAIRTILNRSIAAGGTTIRDYRNAADQEGAFRLQLQAYGRAGEPCFRCQEPLVSTLVVARTTVFCPSCQRRR